MMSDDSRGAALPPILSRKDHDAPSVFRPENMLREARRQKGLAHLPVPSVCILDPDGDIVLHIRAERNARRSTHWACYHTEMWEWEGDDQTRYGIIGSAVGGSFAVLVAEQLFACGCDLLISIASAGQIRDVGPPPYHILIDRALRDEGTSYHYLPPAPFVSADAPLLEIAAEAFGGCRHLIRGATWTTDAPFRETAASIETRQQEGIVAVEMEAAALYAFAAARNVPVLCLAHVTNRLGCVENDFEKGFNNGACSSLDLVERFASAWRANQPSFVAAAQ